MAENPGWRHGTLRERHLSPGEFTASWKPLVHLCTMWLADYLTDIAAGAEDLKEPISILEWVVDHALLSGVLAEQVHPETGTPLSVSPLTWSHATFVASCQRILQKMSAMQLCPKCGLSFLSSGVKEDWIEQLYEGACCTIRGICAIK